MARTSRLYPLLPATTAADVLWAVAHTNRLRRTGRRMREDVPFACRSAQGRLRGRSNPLGLHLPIGITLLQGRGRLGHGIVLLPSSGLRLALPSDLCLAERSSDGIDGCLRRTYCALGLCHGRTGFLSTRRRQRWRGHGFSTQWTITSEAEFVRKVNGLILWGIRCGCIF